MQPAEPGINVTPRPRRWLVPVLLLGVLGLSAWAGASGDLLALDRATHLASQAHRTPLGDSIARGFRRWGEAWAYLPAVLGLLLAARVRADPQLRRWAWQVALALILSGVLCWALKLSVGRARPRWSDAPDSLRPFSSATSFPSGHTTAAFALSTSLAAGLASPPATVALVALAAGTGWSRVNDDRHWLSDVVVGALLGLLSTVWVRRRYPAAGLRTSAAGRSLPEGAGR